MQKLGKCKYVQQVEKCSLGIHTKKEYWSYSQILQFFKTPISEYSSQSEPENGMKWKKASWILEYINYVLFW